MQKKYIVVSFLAAVLGFVGGFLVANSINRTELSGLRGENERLKVSPQPAANNAGDEALTEDEINARIEEADKNPENLQFQKNLGLALYRYGAMKQDTELIGRSIRLLERAEGLGPNDRAIKVALGNAHFDVGYFSRKNESFEAARKYYEQALQADPADIEIRTDVGLTYFLQEPPDFARAIENFRASLERSPGHEKTLQFMIQTLLKQGDHAEAEKYLDQLKRSNPDSRGLAELTKMVGEKRGDAR